MIFKIRTDWIDYCVEEEDVCEEICEDVTIEEDSEEFYDAIHAKIEEIKDSLPQNLELEVECDEEEIDYLDELVCDEITETTGWLINGFDYKVIERRRA